MSAPVFQLPTTWRHLQRRALLVGLAALVALVIGGWLDPAQFFRAYLAAYLFFLGIGLGSMALLMIYHITGGAWGFLIRRILEAAMRTLPLAAVGFLPIALGAHWLYPFAMRGAAANEQLVKQQPYMNLPFFWGRAAVFFSLWLIWMLLLSAASRRQDRTGDPRLALLLDGLGSSGLVVYGITMHFAAIDWLMSLQPAFHSTIFGPIAAVGQLLSALALALVVLGAVYQRPPLAEVVSAKACNDLGTLLFSFVIIWTYMGYFQYMLIWIANLQVDVIWYLPRTAGPWFWVAMVLVVFHFVVPFVLLLWRAVKQNPAVMARIGLLLLAMQLLFMELQVQPAFEGTTLAQHWMDFVSPVALGGIWIAYYLRQLEGWPLVPLHDANEASAVHLRHSDEEEAALEEALAHG